MKAEVQQQIVETSAFVISQEDIDSVLQSGSNVQEGKFRIYRQFSKNETPKENEAFLRNEYGMGGFPVIGSDIYEQHNSTGITITKSHNSTIHLSWQQVEKRISQLINADRYLNSKEKAQYPQWQVNQTTTIEIPPTQETTQSVYSFSVGDKVFLGADDYQITYIDDTTVKLHDLKFPIFEKEFSRSEFETKIRENPLNEHLKVALNTDVSEQNKPVQYTREQYYSFIDKTVTYDLRKYVVDDIDITAARTTIATVTVAPVVHHTVTEVHIFCLYIVGPVVGAVELVLCEPRPLVAGTIETGCTVLYVGNEVMVERGQLTAPDTSIAMLTLGVTRIGQCLA